MCAPKMARTTDKRKKRSASNSKVARTRIAIEERESVVWKHDTGRPSTVEDESDQRDATLNDPAIVSAGRPRRLPAGKKGNNVNLVIHDEKAEELVEEKAPARSARRSNDGVESAFLKDVPKNPRAMKREGGNEQTYSTARKDIESGAGKEADVFASAKIATREPLTNQPRYRMAKGKKEVARPAPVGGDSRAEQHQSQDKQVVGEKQEQGQSNHQARKQQANHATSRKALATDTLAQHTAIQDAAAILACNNISNFASNPLYANLLASNLAQQQLATAQVLANLRASVNGFRPMKNVENAAAYDASRVPCLADRDDINTTTNIYVNNLPAHTSDDDLLRLGACFGPVKSHKAIINQETGLCKGYGFIMYEQSHDAETALQQLPLHGLTTSWAKESFSTKLRKLSDNCSTNVYISNLPLDMTPHLLEQLFSPHFVVSLRILLDDNGNSRGVGFVRLRDRDTAQECIDKLHGKLLVGQATPLQARFADSEAQKRLKQNANQVITSEAPAAKPTNLYKNVGLMDTAGLVDPLYLASLQGLQNWAGFGTPQNSSAAAFASPRLDLTSPSLGYAQFPPSNPSVNWNQLLSSTDLYGNALFPSAGSPSMFGLNYNTSIYSPSSMATSINSPYAHMSANSLSPLSFSSTPLTPNTPSMARTEASSKRSESSRVQPTYLPADVHQQHAKALLEAQGRLPLGSPQADELGLLQLLGRDSRLPNAYSPDAQLQMLHHHTDIVANALGMSGMSLSGKEATAALAAATRGQSEMTKSTIDPQDDRSGLNLPVTRPELTSKGEMSVLREGAKTISPLTSEEVSLAEGNAAASPSVQEPSIEECDSLVIDSGHASSAEPFFGQEEKTMPVEETIGGLTKSDSGKDFVNEKEVAFTQAASVTVEAITTSLI